MTHPKLWTRDFIIVSVLNFLLVLVFYLLVVVIGLYASRDLQATASQAGLVVGVFIVGSLVGRLLTGQVLDRLGRKRCMITGLFLAILTCLLYFINAGIGFLIFTRFLHGVSIGVAATATATVVAHLVPASRRGEGLGYFGVSASLATAIGPFIGMLMVQRVDFEVILAFCTVMSVVCLIVGFMLGVPELTDEQRAMPRQQVSFNSLLERRVIPVCSIMLFAGVLYSSVLSYLNTFAVERDLVSAASFFFMVYAMTVLVSRPFAGKIMDNRGANIIMYPGLLLMGLGLAGIGWAQSGLLLLSAAVLLGLGFGSIQICIQAIVIQQVEAHKIGLATSTFFIFVDAGLGFGPYFLGLIVPYLGYGNLYLALGVLSLAPLVMYHFIHGVKE
ncbi:MFS transporter [Pseudomaricurvus sp.]|uniref:MFS transporter n=1 Tax=Pseudomaricurvus sp. TaxID=2004510 RepID=UPI003F6A7C4F